MRESRSSAVLSPADATSTALMTCSRDLALSRGGGPFGFGSSVDVPEIAVTPDGGTRTISRTVSRELTTKAPTMNATAATATAVAANRAQTTLVYGHPLVTASPPVARYE